MKTNLIVNTGSMSAKYSLYAEGQELFFGHFELAGEKSVVTFYPGGRKNSGNERSITEADFADSLNLFVNEAITEKIIESKEDISAIGVRVVASGTYFQKDNLVDEDFLARLSAKKEEQPLHVPVTLHEIDSLKKIFPTTPILGISDSAYHRDAPDTARFYALPKSLAAELDLYHFGYHGISVGSIVKKIATRELLPSKIVVCHLGGGSSITAVREGKSFDTSMGYTPLEGLVTSTRSGNIDPVAVMLVREKLGKNLSETQAYFNKECGMLGLSGKSSDVRELLELERAGDVDARLALDKFVMSIKHYIGAYTAEMGGIDMLVFSGTIGERSSSIRQQVCVGLECLGIKLDLGINESSKGIDAQLNTSDSPVKIVAVCTDEMSAMAEHLTALQG